MAGYLLDTNHLGSALRERSALRHRLLAAHRLGTRIGTCTPVLCESEAGLAPVIAAERCITAMRRMLSFVRIWPLDPPIAAMYGEIHLNVRRRGRVLSQVDMMLAALCRHLNLTLLTTDRDFEALPDLRTENWVSP
jgi:tRNA(fMet)-specific endonuclease VapC